MTRDRRSTDSTMARNARRSLGDTPKAFSRLRLALALLQLGLHQHVVEDAGDGDAHRLLDIVGVDGDLEVGPESLQVVPVNLRRRLMF